ncbi:LLM class flavin-dependent oxidoreductase [Saccharopolyspora rosea]|uniref:LLM class flavin-dependent oxidoreductase n=1 Tax=Saccharopolyspora rosea TaxID=524884 RepID=A0ABW3FQI4_9PSEU|nr:LLM class flavin-dependent oxidoreductase [Saccharopolyspora rosea]
MKLAVNLELRHATALAACAEDLGYELALAPEGYRSEAASVLGAVAAATERIALGSCVMQIPARPPATTALTAASLDVLSGGRFRLGLGVSNPDVSEGWYGVPFAEPLARTREYLDIVRAALRGEPVTYRGRHFRLPIGDRTGAPLHLYTEGHRPDLPIYLAAVGPANLRLTGEIADGWLGVFNTPESVTEARDHLAAGRAKRGRSLDGFAAIPCVPAAVDDDPATAADQLRGQYAYLLGIGDRETNIHCALARRLGFGDAVERIHDHLAADDRPAAARAVPFELIDSTSLIGPPDRIARRLAGYADAGATAVSIMVSAAATDLAGRLRILRSCAEALRRLDGQRTAAR